MADHIQDIVDPAESQDIEDETAAEKNCRGGGFELFLGAG
jgi:hypothetical protein